jgi:hypothetical protein
MHVKSIEAGEAGEADEAGTAHSAVKVIVPSFAHIGFAAKPRGAART